MKTARKGQKVATKWPRPSPGEKTLQVEQVEVEGGPSVFPARYSQAPKFFFERRIDF
ncbi:MAG TPA: hypothetical protein VIU12_28350 [Chryseolinea sp.]